VHVRQQTIMSSPGAKSRHAEICLNSSSITIGIAKLP
jgi:hypothetical protein